MKVAIYIRVSTTKQDYENQLAQLREYCTKNGWSIYKIYQEVISGKESDRPIFKEMMLEATQKKFDTVLVWALDRFTREGVNKVWNYITTLDYHKVDFRSYKEPYLNTDNKMQRDLLFSVMGILAEQERLRISDRTKAALQKLKDRGIKLGREPIKNKIKDLIVNLHEQGKSYREICQEVSYWDKNHNKHYVSMGFVHKTLKNASTN